VGVGPGGDEGAVKPTAEVECRLRLDAGSVGGVEGGAKRDGQGSPAGSGR